MVCQGCGFDNAGIARFCGRCGRAVAEPVLQSATTVTPLVQQWRKLAHTLTRKELRKLLGEPLRIESKPGSDGAAIETWVYEYVGMNEDAQLINGWVTLSVAESRVIGWSEPDWTRIRA